MLILYQLFPLSSSASRSRCRFWRIIVIVGVSALTNRRKSCRRRHLVVVVVLLLSEAMSLLVAAFVGFCALLSAASCRCRWRRRHPSQN